MSNDIDGTILREAKPGDRWLPLKALEVLP